MPSYIYATRCSGCGDCIDICPSDILHYDRSSRKAVNVEPEACWECFNCVKVCGRQAANVRGYADFVPMGASIAVTRDEKSNTITWVIRYRNGTTKKFTFPIRTTRWGSIRPPTSYPEPDPLALYDEVLSFEPEKLFVKSLPTLGARTK